jgi:hypothetical protein
MARLTLHGLIGLTIVTWAFGLHAQPIPKAFAAPGTRGQVVDAESGAPIDGAVVVARWEWEQSRYVNGGGGYSNYGQSVHVGEAVTGADGRFAIAKWAATMTTGGRMADDAPRLLAFRSGYEPQAQQASAGTTVRLKKFSGDGKEYAKLIANFQEGSGGLAWSADENWPAFPKMVMALQRERARLGADGTSIVSAERMRDRTGDLRAIDSATNMEANEHGVIWIEWTMRRADGAPGSRRVVQTLPTSTLNERYVPVSPWRLPGPQVAGWEIDPAVKPLVRVYMTGYQRSADVRWEEKGGKITVTKLDGSREAVIAELRARRKDIDSQLAQGDRAEALGLQQPMLANFQFQCARLTPDLQAGLCFDANSDVARAIYAANHRDVEVRKPQASAQVAAVPARPQGTVPVKGFTIELAQP